jgi:hypothetical protein
VLEYFISTINRFQTKDNSKTESEYSEYLSRRDIWDNLSTISEAATRDVVLKFLNQWGCRIPLDSLDHLSRALRDSYLYLIPFEGLEVHNFMNCTDEWLMLDSLENLFNHFSEVDCGSRRFGFTATSKLLHMIKPDLFVMCDARIRLKYGCVGNDSGYANFMYRMNILSRLLIEEAGSSKEKLIESISLKIPSIYQNVKLTRLVDIYNSNLISAQ